VEGVTVRCDAKEWKPTEPLKDPDSTDPYGPIRAKMDKGKEKFKEYKGRGEEACCLVLYRHGPQPISLDRSLSAEPC